MQYIFKVGNDQYISSNYKNIISDSINFATAKFIFEDMWTGYAKSAVFTNSLTGISVDKPLSDNNDCLIPWEPLDCREDANITVCIKGTKEDKVIYTKMKTPLRIITSDKTLAATPLAPTPQIYDQILNLVKEKASSIKYENGILSLMSTEQEISNTTILSVSNVAVSGTHLIITMNNGSIIDAGVVVPNIDLNPYVTDLELESIITAVNQDISTKHSDVLALIDDIIDDSKEALSSTYSSAKIKQLLDLKANGADLPSTLPASDVYAWAKAPVKPSYSADEVGALEASIPLFDGAYSSLSGSPQIPTKTSQLINDSNYSIGTPIVKPLVTTMQLDPNTFYNFGEVASLTLTLNENTNSPIVEEFIFQFKCPIGASTILSLPADIKWIGGLQPVLLYGKTYQFSIINKLGVSMEW